jgi:hypothetical protein
MSGRPLVGIPSAEARAAVEEFAAGLQAGHDQRDADILNRQFATGPWNTLDTNGVSVHFRDDEWIIHAPEGS